MATVQGTQVQAALRKASAWGTALAAGAGHGLYVKTPGDVTPEREMVMDEAVGSATVRQIDYGNTPAIAEDVVGDLYYEGWDIALALAMGSAGVPSLASSGGTAYNYVYALANSRKGLFGTYVVRRNAQIFEYPSLKMNGFEITGEAGQAMQVAMKNIRNTLVRNSGVNTNSTFNNVTYPDRVNRIMFNQGTFRLNRNTDGALGGSDIVKPSSISISYTDPLEGDFVMDGNDYITEPDPTGQIEAKLELTFPQWDDATTYLANFLAASNAAKYEYKADVTFTGASIGANAYQMKFQFPRLHLDVPQSSTGGTGKIEQTLTFTGLLAASAPAGMVGITQPIHLTGTNTRSTNPLA